MLILKLLVFAIPVTFAAILHMISVKTDILQFFKYPVDFKKTWNNQRIFGDSKTFRGIFLMVIYCIAGCGILLTLEEKYESVHQLSVLNFEKHSIVFYGILLGLAYTLAELPNSFIKRQMGIENGKRGNVVNILVDQADSPIGCMLAVYPFSDMTLSFFIAGSFFFLFLHMFFNVLLFLMRLRKNPL